MLNNISEHIGKRYGHLTVIGVSKLDSDIKCSSHFDFKCDCGAIISDLPSRIISGHRTSCGKCSFRKKETKPRFSFEQYIGRNSNKLTVIGISERLPSDKRWFLKCQCDCGNTIRVTPYQFDNEKIKSCGCLNHISPSRIDGRTLNPLYGLWFNMISRCENLNHSKYYRYGKRGIKVCDSWHDFNNFVKWSDSIGGRPQNCTLDRIDNDENYSPENCRWATSFQQSVNKSSNIILEYNGESKTLIEWSISTGIKWCVLDKRLKLGWPVSEILNTPVGVERQSKVRKRVIQFDTNENCIKIYNNLSDIPNTFTKKCVNACCLGKRKTHNGYVWKYEGE